MKTYKPYELSKEMGVEIQTIYRWIREGKIPAGNVQKVNVIKERTIIKMPKEIIDKYNK